MIDGVPPSQQALYGTLFTWFVTALGSGVVFVEPLLPGSPAVHQLFLDTMLGFAGGVMIAASYWSLLAPGVSFARKRSPRCTHPATLLVATLPCASYRDGGAGLVWQGEVRTDRPFQRNRQRSHLRVASSCCRVCGRGSIPGARGLRALSARTLVDWAAPRNRHRTHLTQPCSAQMIGLLLASTDAAEAAQAKKTDGSSAAATPAAEQSSLEVAAVKSGSWRRILLLVFAITLHNIPEGLAVGVRMQRSKWRARRAKYLVGYHTRCSVSVITFRVAGRLCATRRSPLVVWVRRLARSSTHAASKTHLT